MNINPRVRFAPSPTGFLHVGGLRTALYNFLFAKKNNGKLILRIEDTDQNRYIADAAQNLIKILDWAGIEFDEGPNIGGNFGPYYQSQRLELYKKYADQLLKEENAYYCFCTPERLENMRNKQKDASENYKYDRMCLSLSKEEILTKLDQNIPYTIRLKIPNLTTTLVNDLIRGAVEFQNILIDDQVLIKSDGFPTYHLANVIDDHLMEITHVIRGEEWLSSTPKHVILYNYFNWNIPEFAHLPLLLNPDKSKLSKRQGDVAVEDYKAKGYLKEALLNFVALLGWNPGDEQEYFLQDDLISRFSLEKVNKSGAVFNLEKLNWLNGEHLRKKLNQDILITLKNILSKSKYDNNYTDDYLLKIISVMKERIIFIEDIIRIGNYFFERPENYDSETIKKRWNTETPDHLKSLISIFKTLENPTPEDYENALRKTGESLKIGAGKLIHAVRLALSGVGNGPGVFDLLYIIGLEESLIRINQAIEKVKIIRA